MPTEMREGALKTINGSLKKAEVEKKMLDMLLEELKLIEF